MAGASLKGGIVEYLSPGAKWTAEVDEAAGVAGGNVLVLTGNRTVGLAGANEIPVGVALHDQVDNEEVSIISEGVVPLKAAGAIAAGDLVGTAAAGAVATIAAAGATYVQAEANEWRTLVGVALEAIADTAVGRVRLKI